MRLSEATSSNSSTCTLRRRQTPRRSVSKRLTSASTRGDLIKSSSSSEQTQMKMETTPLRLKRSYYTQKMADAPAKCLLPDDRFRRLNGLITDRYIERDDEGNYSVHPEQHLFDGQIEAVHDVSELTDDHIRYLFFCIEDQLRAIAGEGKSLRHRLFMADRGDVLNFAMPFMEFTDSQRTLIRNLCQDHLRIKSGFNDFYLMQVLIPEACIRIHMAVHGTTFEISDKALDPGLIDLEEAIRDLQRTQCPKMEAQSSIGATIHAAKDGKSRKKSTRVCPRTNS